MPKNNPNLKPEPDVVMRWVKELWMFCLPVFLDCRDVELASLRREKRMLEQRMWTLQQDIATMEDTRRRVGIYLRMVQGHCHT